MTRRWPLVLCFLIFVACGKTAPKAPAPTLSTLPATVVVGTLNGKVQTVTCFGNIPVTPPVGSTSCQYIAKTAAQVELATSGGTLLQTTSTDSSGNFSFTIPAGTYVVTVSDGNSCVTLPRPCPPSQTVTVGATNDPLTFDFEVLPM